MYEGCMSPTPNESLPLQHFRCNNAIGQNTNRITTVQFGLQLEAVLVYI